MKRKTILIKDLRLKFIKVHKGRVSYIKKDDAYFACADFKNLAILLSLSGK